MTREECEALAKSERMIVHDGCGGELTDRWGISTVVEPMHCHGCGRDNVRYEEAVTPCGCNDYTPGTDKYGCHYCEACGEDVP